MGLLDKFENVTTNPKDRLSNEDMAYCDRKTAEANEILAELKIEWLRITEAFDKETMGYKISDHRYVTRPSHSYENFNRYRWTNAFDVLHVESLMKSLVYDYKEKILTYFATKYNLTLKDRSGSCYGMVNNWRDDLKGADQFNPLDYDIIMDYITEVTGGLNFREVGEKAFIESFQRNFKTWRGNPQKHTLKGATLQIDDFCGVYTGYSSKYRYELSSTFAETERALNFFESGDLTSGYLDKSMSRLDGENCDFSEIFFTGFTKTKSIKLFKNRRMDIKFISATHANEFIKLFELDNLELKD